MSEAPVAAVDISDAGRASRPVHVALMGLGERSAAFQAAIRSHPRLALVGVADTVPAPLRPFAGHETIKAYVDYRSLVVESAQSGLDLLFVGLEPFQSREFVALAGSRGLSVFHTVPPARTIREARELEDRFASGGATLAVWRWWAFEPASSALDDLAAAPEVVQTAFVDVQTTQRVEGWRGDRSRAGGGVLLNDAYDAVDLLVGVLGMPETVYACCACLPLPDAGRHDTEDVAVLTLTFSGGAVGSVRVRRVCSRPGWRAAFDSAAQTVEVERERLSVRPTDGGRARHRRVRPDANPLVIAIDALLAAREGAGAAFRSTIAEHLPTLATIEAAYLSARTGEAESPGRLLGA